MKTKRIDLDKEYPPPPPPDPRLVPMLYGSGSPWWLAILQGVALFLLVMALLVIIALVAMRQGLV